MTLAKALKQLLVKPETNPHATKPQVPIYKYVCMYIVSIVKLCTPKTSKHLYFHLYKHATTEKKLRVIDTMSDALSVFDLVDL